MKKRTVFNPFVLFLSLTLLMAWSSCSQKTDKDIILDTMEEIGEKAEQRDIEGILQYISSEYKDDENRTKTEIRKQIEENFERHKGIVANILATEIIEISLPEAKIKTDVVFSSGAAKMLRKLINFAGDCYRFTLQLIKEEELWKVKSATWDYISVEELLPDSINLLKK